MSGGKDGQILFHRIRPATTMGLTSKIAAFKSQRYRVLLLVLPNLLHHNQFISIDFISKISSIHKLIQQILGSHELNGHTQF